METYPSIPALIINTPIYAFDKLDGSNIRVEWSRKTGFMKYGTRRRLLDAHDTQLGEAIPLFMEKYSEDLEKIFRKQRYERATAFLEFYGTNSFAGFHENETHTVTLFDVHVYKKGMMSPKEFLKTFADQVETPPLLFAGNPTQDFQQSVKQSTLEGMTFEGVVCKGSLNSRRQVQTFKLKSYAWLEKLKGKYGADTALLNKLI